MTLSDLPARARRRTHLIALGAAVRASARGARHRPRRGVHLYPCLRELDHGGFIYRGSRFASLLGGRYVGGDFGSGKVFYSSGGGLVTAGQLSNVTSFGEDDSRELSAVTYDGGLYQMSVA